MQISRLLSQHSPGTNGPNGAVAAAKLTKVAIRVYPWCPNGVEKIANALAEQILAALDV
jgi:hypothetical protein